MAYPVHWYLLIKLGNDNDKVIYSIMIFDDDLFIIQYLIKED